MSKRALILPALAVGLTAAAGAVSAGDVTLHSFNPNDGVITEVARGKMKHEPAFVVTPSDLFVIDSCGNAVGLMEDRYGDKTLGEPVVSDSDSLKALKAVDHTGAWGMDKAGVLHQFAFNSYDSRRSSEVRRFNDEPVSEAKVFIHGDQEKPMFIDDRGNLVELRTSGTSIAGLRRVGGLSGLSDVVGGVRTGFFKNGKVNPAVLLIKNNGTAISLDLADDGTNLTSKSEPKAFAGDFSGTVLMFRGSSDDQTLIRVTDKGEMFRVDFAKQTQEKISLPAAVHKKAVGEDNRKIVYASTSGSFDACPAAAVEATVEPEKIDDKGLFALLARLEEQAAKHNRLFDRIKDVAKYAPDGVQTVAEYLAFYGDLATEVNTFNSTDGRQIAADVASLQNDYREEGGAARFLSDLTNGERRDVSIPVFGLISSYERYVEDVATIATRLASTASNRHMIAEYQGSADEQVSAYKDAREFARLALLFDASSSRAQGIIRDTDQYVADALAAERNALANNVWPESFRHFDGPGDAKELEAAAFAYLHDKRGDASVLRVQLRGDWYVWQTNLVGEALNYCLPIYIGSADATYPERGHVTEGEVCTRFNRMAPPFSVSKWSKVSYVIQKSRIR